MLGDPHRPEVPPSIKPAAAAPRSGPYTTEFWLTLAGIAAGVALVMAGHVEIGAGVLMTVIPGYALSRGRSKAAGR